MVKSFDAYLKELKDRQVGINLNLQSEIDFYPKMIEPLYRFIQENNDQYERIVFGEDIRFKGNFESYFKAINQVVS